MTNLEVFEKQEELIEMINNLKAEWIKRKKKPSAKTS